MPDQKTRALTAIVIIGLLLAVGALVLFGWLADEVLEGDTIRFDDHIRSEVHGFSNPPLTTAMLFFTTVGSLLVEGPLTALLLWVFWRIRWRRAAVLLLITLAGAAVLVVVLKLAFHRARPVPYFGLKTPGTYSFPSGHALFAMCLYSILASLIAGRISGRTLRVLIWMFAGVLIASIGFSRIYLGVHYPTDVIAGYAAGFIWVTAVSFGDRLHRLRL